MDGWCERLRALGSAACGIGNTIGVLFSALHKFYYSLVDAFCLDFTCQLVPNPGLSMIRYAQFDPPCSFPFRAFGC